MQALLDGCGFRTELLSHSAYISLPGAARVAVDGTSLVTITRQL
ncbi:MAG TPA: hypothetical protein VNT30_23815 [Stellaceae bacterium]|nr:hypothetical protein [Stellaceae bacterium]